MECQLKQYVPKTWANNGCDRNLVLQSTQEYTDLEALFKDSNCKVNRIERYENIYRYVAFLVRQQHLVAMEPAKKYFQTRRYAHVAPNDITKSVEHQMDSRYVPQLEKTFRAQIGNPIGTEVFVMSVVTNSIDGAFTPERDSDFYIEYIVYLD